MLCSLSCTPSGSAILVVHIHAVVVADTNVVGTINMICYGDISVGGHNRDK